MIGEYLGSYRVQSKIGAGAIGEVYLAEHPLIGRKVAIKVLQQEFSTDPEIVSRFFNEARATAMIGHPGLVDALDFGMHQPSGAAYIVMEYLVGDTLSQHLERMNRLQPDVLIAVALQIASAAGAAHQRGIVHRDLKPDNVIIVSDQAYPFAMRIKVLDFGIAKLSDATNKTRTGKLLGTPLYMSPEQCTGSGAVDHRADIYSLGIMMYEMACGKPPFGGRGVYELIMAHQNTPPVPPRQHSPLVPPELEAVILRALAKRADQRYQSMAELAQDLERVSGGRLSGAIGAVQQQTLMAPSAGPQPITVMGGNTLAQRMGAAPPTVPADAVGRGGGGGGGGGAGRVLVVTLVILAALGTGAYFLFLH